MWFKFNHQPSALHATVSDSHGVSGYTPWHIHVEVDATTTCLVFGTWSSKGGPQLPPGRFGIESKKARAGSGSPSSPDPVDWIA